MRKPGVLLIVLPLLVGCTTAGGYGAARPEPQPAPVPPSLDWNTALAGDVVEIELTDPTGYYRVERIALIGPAGQSHEAFELIRETIRRHRGAGGGRVGVGLGGGYGGRSGGAVSVGLSIPVTGPPRADMITHWQARVRLPDPDAYRRTAGQWRLEVLLTDPAGAASLAEIPAPGPMD